MAQIQAIKGFADSFPEQSRVFEMMEETARKVFPLYGFGELIDSAQQINAKLGNNGGSKTVNQAFSPAPAAVNPVVVRNKFDIQNAVLGKCEMCDAEDVNVIKCRIVDELGTRYRSICKKCMDKYSATPVDK